MVAESAPTILVVDDDAQIRQFVCEALDFEGYEARASGDGRAALDVLAGWQPDLILLDLNMPHMDGWTFCARQQETSRDREYPDRAHVRRAQSAQPSAALHTSLDPSEAVRA